MKISIITTIYKAEKDLPRLLDSMMAQKSQELEFFLIDNGSPDRCGEICREYEKKDKRFKVYTIRDNVGYIRARNMGIQLVDADYVGFCDSDDYLEQGGYDKAIERIKSTGCDLYITSYNTVSAYNTVTNHIPYSQGIYEGEQIEKEIIPQAFGSLPNKPALHGFAWKQIFRRSIFLDNNLEFMPELQPYEDQILNIDFIRNSKKVYIDDTVIYNYLVNVESITAKLASNFKPSEEWDRIVKFYNEKERRVTDKCQEEALSNQMLGFVYAMFLNTAKRVNITAKSSSIEFRNCCDMGVIKTMIGNISVQKNIRTSIFKILLGTGNYRIVLSGMRFVLKLRG